MDKFNVVFGFSLVFLGVISNLVPELLYIGEVAGLFFVGVGLIFLTNLLRKKPA